MSTNAIATFTFPVTNSPIRVINRDGKPWFVAKEVALILGYKNPSKAILDHCKHPELLKGNESLLLTSSPRGINVIPEGDVYRLITKSTLESAQKFEEWMMDVIMPSVRKDGGYVVGEEKVLTGEMSEDELLLKAMTILTKKVERLTAERDSLQAKVIEHLDYLTVDEWRALNHLYLVHADKVMLGKLASARAKERGVRLDVQARRVCTSRGFKDVKVNVYPANILDEVAMEAGIIHRLQSAV